jgi:hypothetical protein
VATEQLFFTLNDDLALELGNGECFFPLSVVKLLGQFGVDLADVMEEPAVELGGVLGMESKISFGFEGESDADEVGICGNESFAGGSICHRFNSRLGMEARDCYTILNDRIWLMIGAILKIVKCV